VVAAPISFLGGGLILRGREALQTGVLLSASEILAYGIRDGLKVTVKRDRPYNQLRDVHVDHLDSTDPYSFPSGHTTGAFALATMLSFRYPKAIVIIPAFTWAALVGYGRIYFGLHYPTDGLAGAVIGVGSALLINTYSEEIFKLSRSVLGDRCAIMVPDLLLYDGSAKSELGRSAKILSWSHK
jgi:undecaprenyl-diphosphatase